MKRVNLFWIIVVMALGLSSRSFASSRLIFKEAPLAQVLEALSKHYGVCIIKDPSVQGVVHATIDMERPIEAVLTDILSPLGYSFTAVDKVYLVSGTDSPRTVFVEWETYRIPVGFLDSKLLTELAEFSPYLKYDMKLGLIFIKAPSSKVNEILGKLWSISSSRVQTAVIYSLCIVDMTNVSDEVSRLFRVSNDGSSSTTEGMITLEQMRAAGDWVAIFSKISVNRSDWINRQPWVAVLPGRTAQLVDISHYVGDQPEEDQRFRLGITPVMIDPDTGCVTTRIELEGDESRKSSVMSTVTTGTGAFEPIAIVRRNHSKRERFWFGYRQQQESRTYGLFLTAIPLNLQLAFPLSHGNFMSVANLQGFNLLEESGKTLPLADFGSRRELVLGFNGEGRGIHPWFIMNLPLNQRMTTRLEYESQNCYELKLKWGLEYLKGAAWELKIGEGNGPRQCSSVSIGLTDETKWFHRTTLYAGYYQTYSLDDKKTLDSGYWEVGARCDEGTLRWNVSAMGGSKVNKYKMRLEWDIHNLTWILGIDDLKMKERYKLGIKFSF